MALIETVGVKNTQNTQIDPATEETLNELKRILSALKSLTIVTGSGSNRLSVDVNNIVAGLITTITTLTTCSTLTNQANVGNVNSFMQVQGQQRLSAQAGIYNNLIFN